MIGPFRWSALTFAILVASSAAAPQSGPRLQFNRDIRPILTENCFPCHGPDKNKRQANLRLDDRRIALERAAIAPGRPDQSHLVQRINSTNSMHVMPPLSSHKKLTETQRRVLARWIKEGAEYQAHWSYMPLLQPAIPRIENRKLVLSTAEGSKIENPIDAFILAKLQQKGITASPSADRPTLIRRVYLDLIGIPPTPKEVREFVNDKSSNAYEKIVDLLLASPRYGERMAVPWLDLVRYADTVGYHGDQNMNAWAYRDYVIDSFNKNKPFDRFPREQLAGDLISNPTPETLTATCFNRLNMVTREGGAQPKEYMAKYAADRVRTVSMTWLGSTMGCCECHDHKYDPFSTKDFYSMAALFADIKQWGVYQDYGYTPNPDLRGFTNEHPFPPEIKVESTYLVRRIAQDRAKCRQVAVDAAKTLSKDEKQQPAFKAWRRAAADYAAEHADGWEAPSDTLIVRGDGKPDGDKPLFERKLDGSLVVTAAAPPEVSAILTPKAPWIASIRIDLLPDLSHGASVLRAGSGTRLTPVISLRRKSSESPTPLYMRYASASAYSPTYDNGFDILGVHGGWRIPTENMKERLTSVWILDTPQKLEPGDQIIINFKGARVGCVSVAVSPFAPENPDIRSLPDSIADGLRSTSPEHISPAALEAYLRGTAWNAGAYGKIKALDMDMAECRGGQTPVMVVQAMTPPVIRVLPRGNWQDERGEIVQPAVPHFLPQPGTAAGRRLTRLDLAEWIVSPNNPLTARVFMNRLWKQLFGVGLSDSVEDVGAQGESPSNPDLLDWLAVEFREGSNPKSTTPTHPWDVKRMVKLIVMSATYRQTSRPRPELKNIDPSNRLLASQNPRRLEAEFVRDNALAIAGILNSEIGGAPGTRGMAGAAVVRPLLPRPTAPRVRKKNGGPQAPA